MVGALCVCGGGGREGVARPRNPTLKRPRRPWTTATVQELCECRGGRPGLSVLTSLLVSVDVKLY